MYPHLSFAPAAILPALFPSALAAIFTVNCAPLTVQRGDPVIYPGVISAHVHAVVGGTAFALTQSNEDARAAKATTCDKVLDKSNYWQPQLYHHRADGKFEIVNMQGTAAYYIARACDYAEGRELCSETDPIRAPPKGLRMVVGNPKLRAYNESNFEQQAISHVCLSKESGMTPHLPTEPCERLRSQTFFPSCWDGINLDSEDHKSHMAFPAIGAYNGGVCPKSHPYAIMAVFYEFFYDTGAIKDFNRLVYSMGDPTGYGLHGDYLNGWTNQTALENAFSTCMGPEGIEADECTLNVRPGGPGCAERLRPETPPPNEDVGLKGPIDSLPGDNPIVGEPVKIIAEIAS